VGPCSDRGSPKAFTQRQLLALIAVRKEAKTARFLAGLVALACVRRVSYRQVSIRSLRSTLSPELRAEPRTRWPTLMLASLPRPPRYGKAGEAVLELGLGLGLGLGRLKIDRVEGGPHKALAPDNVRPRSRKRAAT
jgi:hypothetical protein